MNRGIIYAISAYIFWGIHPIYWKQLQTLPSDEIVAHRIIWSLLFFVFIVSTRGQWGRLKSKINSAPNKWILVVPAFLIGSNWAMYIWAVNAGYIIETSLGYFICPLVSVFLGVFVLKEKLLGYQWAAISIAVSGVLIMTFVYGFFPWISLYLAVTWGAYGLMRKKSPLSATEGLLLETSILSIPAFLYLLYLFQTISFAFLSDFKISLFLIGSGIISGLPLIIFISASKMIKLSLIGILQYIYPTLIFLIGYYIYNEPMDEVKIIGFTFIWIALLLYTFGNKLKFRLNKG